MVKMKNILIRIGTPFKIIGEENLTIFTMKTFEEAVEVAKKLDNYTPKIVMENLKKLNKSDKLEWIYFESCIIVMRVAERY